MARNKLLSATVVDHGGTVLWVVDAEAHSWAAISSLVEVIVENNSPKATYYVTDDKRYVSVTVELAWYEKEVTLHLHHKPGDEMDVAESMLNWLSGQMLTGHMTLTDVTSFLEKYDVNGLSL